jgi:16S rRNA (guanine527-N7)-methyltransferase
VGGRLVVSDPPDPAADRWSNAGLSALGFGPPHQVRVPEAFTVVEQAQPCPDRFPRRVGIPGKRPLF